MGLKKQNLVAKIQSSANYKIVCIYVLLEAADLIKLSLQYSSKKNFQTCKSNQNQTKKILWGTFFFFFFLYGQENQQEMIKELSKVTGSSTFLSLFLQRGMGEEKENV